MGDGNIINNLRHGSLFGYNSNNIIQFPRRYSGRDAEVSGFITSWLSFGNRKAIIGAAEMRKCLDKIFDLAIDERLK